VRELDFIEWVRRQGRFPTAAVSVGPGDDCAVVTLGREKLLLTTDQVLDGVHFELREHGPRAAGRKAMARNLSDVAAMAAVPVAATATVALPRGFSAAATKAIYRGLRQAGDEFDCPLVGGDLACWPGRLAITVTVAARPGPAGVVLRRGARAGDAICVTGRLGGAWRTRRHLRFAPRVREALLLAERYDLHAMIDLSDGLATDLAHLCRAGRVGAIIRAGAVPVHRDARRLAADPLAAALTDGEDYELLFTLPPAAARRLVADQPLGVPVTNIGTIVRCPRRRARGAPVTLIGLDGVARPLRLGGWEHRT